MADISIHKYVPGESTSAINAPHKYRIEKRRANPTNEIENLWNLDKERKVLSVLGKILLQKFDCTQAIAIASAPSNITLFIDDLHNRLMQIFPNAIDFSNCFSKQNNFEATLVNKALTDIELREIFYLEVNCFNEKFKSEIKQFLLIDDVYALGNTLKGMKLLINDINPNFEIITAVILKT